MQRITFYSILLLLSFHITSVAQKSAFEIQFKVAGLADVPLIVAYRYADNQYIKDTIQVNSKGVAIYRGNEALPPGVYLAVFPTMNNNYFEFLVKEQFFTLETDKEDFNKNMKVVNSKENKIFYDDLRYVNDKRVLSEEYNNRLKSFKDNSDSSTYYKNQLKKIDEDVKSFRMNTITSQPDLMYSKIMNAFREIEVPEPKRDQFGKALDTNFQYNYYKQHYWDYVDFKEEGILRSPVYSSKLENYFEKIVMGIPDSIIKECDYVLSKSKVNNEIFKYTLVTLVNKYAQSKIMGMDAVYVHLVNEYYAKGAAYWMKSDTVSLYKMIDRANKTGPLIIGKKAPNLVLEDTTLKVPKSMYDIKSKYTILVFWDPDCGHCKTEIPQLANMYDTLQRMGASVYAVSTISYEEMDKWTSFIKANNLNWTNVADPFFRHNPNFRTVYDISSTPVIYVLDQDKIIRGKRIGVDQLQDFISKYEEYLKAKAKQ